MKKFLSILTISAFLLTAPMAFADNQNQNGVGPDGNNGIAGIMGNQGNDKPVGNAGFLNGDNDDEGGAIGIGGFVIGVKAKDGAVDSGGTSTYNGLTGGIVGAGGEGHGYAIGGTFLGSTSGSVGVTAGGRIFGTSYDNFTFYPGGIEHTIGSYTVSDAEAGGHIDVATSGNRSFAFGGFEAKAAQGAAVFSGMGSAPIQNADFLTGGFAAQGSIGYVEGSACTTCRYGYPAGAAGDVYMFGATEAYSFRGVSQNNGQRTEYAGSFSGASTLVDSFGYTYGDSGRRRNAHIEGGYIAAGLTANASLVKTENGGGAAGGVAGYLGAASLNTNFSGSSHVTSYVSTTTVNGMQGSIINAGASAHSQAELTNNSQFVD